MERVKWAKVDEIQNGSHIADVMRWVKFDSNNPSSGKNVWDSTKREWTDYIR
jgi:hypothetical protein